MILTCSGAGNSAVPAKLGEGMVCPGTSTLATCSGAASAEAKPVNLREFLAPGAADVSWRKEADQESYSLSVPGVSSYPFIDQEFLVGCKTSSAEVCSVLVALKARESARSGQTVTCAYGAASNSYSVSVTLTPSNNHFTLSCGEGGRFVPSDITANYCTYGEYVEQKDSCLPSLKYSSLIPGFNQSWWSTTTNQATLKIPADQFPAGDYKFAVGCNPPLDAPEASQPTTCSVDVILSKTETSTSPTTLKESAAPPPPRTSLLLAGGAGVLAGGVLSPLVAGFLF